MFADGKSSSRSSGGRGGIAATRPALPVLSSRQRTQSSSSVVNVASRFAVRVRSRRRRRLAMAIATTVVLVAVVWMVWWSPVLQVRSVEVTGTHRVDQEQVRHEVQPWVGTAMLSVDAMAVQHQVATLPLIRSVTLTRSWPGTLVVQVTERTPVAAVPRMGGFDLVDASAVVVEHVTQTPVGVPVVQVASGDRVGLVAVLRVPEQLPDKLRLQVQGLGADSPQLVWLTLTGGIKVVWGDGDKGAQKAAAIQALLTARKSEPGTYNVSAPAAPAFRPGWVASGKA